MGNEGRKSPWLRRLEAAERAAGNLREAGKAFFRGAYPVAGTARGLFSSLRAGLKDGRAKGAIVRLTANDASFGVCLAILIMYAFYFAVAVPAMGRSLLRDSGYSVQAPSAPDPDDPNAPMPLSIMFARSVAPLDAIDRTLADGARLTPAVKGAWSWGSDDLLVFTPAEKWKPGASYEFAFKKSIFSPGARVRPLGGSFAVPAIACSIRDAEFYVHPDDPKIRYLSFTVSCNYPVSDESVRKAIRLRFLKKSLGFSLEADGTGTAFHARSDSIDLPQKSASASVELSGEIASPAFGASRRIGASASIRVPSEAEYASIAGIELQYLQDDSSRYRHALLVNANGRTTVKKVADSLEAWILPKDRPAEKGTEAVENYEWSDADELGPAVMKLAKRIELKPEPSETESTQLAAFTFPAVPSAYIYVKAKAGLSFNGGYAMREDYRAILRSEEIPASARFLKEGVLMSSLGKKTLTVVSYGIGKIGFRVSRVIPDQANHLVTQSRGDFTALEFNDSGDFDETNVSKIYESEFDVSGTAPGEPSYTTLDLTKFMETDLDKRMRYGLFLVDAYRREGESRTRIARRLIMVSDLGFMVKRSLSGTNEVFAMGIRSGRPAAGATVSVIGKNGLEVARATTDAEGHASLPDLRGLQREKAPTAFVVKDDGDMTFLPYEREGRFLDYSNFDSGGEFEAAAKSKISAFLFTDRGIYRPGEAARIGMVVKQRRWTEPVSGVKLALRVSDPRGAVVMEKTVDPGAYGMVEAAFVSRAWSPTGEYQAGLYLDKGKEEWVCLGSASFKVEEFLPDRLKIRADVLPEAAAAGPAKGWIKPEGIRAAIKLDNLFGNPARGNAVKASMELDPAEPAFEGYRDYEFQVSGEQPPAHRVELPATATDAEGRASFDLPTAEFKSPLYRLSFYCQGFEKEGGRNVAAMSQALVSPLDFIVGFACDGSLDYVNRGSARNLKFIAIDPELRRVAAPGLELAIRRRQWVSVLTRMDDGLYKYRSIEKKSTVSENPLPLAAGGASVRLDSSAPGDYEFAVLKDGVELLKRAYSVVGQGNLSRSLDQNAELKVKLDKDDYQPGEAIRVSLTAPYPGTGLVTIERDRIYAWKWFKADSSASVQSIVLPEGIRGNAYINVSFVRASDSREVYMSPLCYGVANFSIARGSLDDGLRLDVPAAARPGQTLSIKYSSGHRGKVVLYGVDEGILQVARYRLPDPLAFFLRKRALEVSTSQILDLILPNFIDDRSPAPGGGEGLEALARNLNPFKRRGQPPVAFWSGVLDCGPEARSYEYQVPDYFNGALRVMAVSAGADSMGSAERRAIVKAPLIVAPQLPAFISPNDELTIPVTVTDNVPGSGKDARLRVTASAGPSLRLESAEQEATVSENGDATVFFKAKALDRPGAVGISIAASCAGATSSYAAEISVRPAVAFRTIVKTGRIAKGEARIPVNERAYYPERRRLELSASYLPLGLSTGLLAYLKGYPYGCSEQIVSQAFPKVALYSVKGFEAFDFKAVSEAVDYACDVLMSRQNRDGSIGLWSASGTPNYFASAYAAHFLTEAREKGFPVPAKLLDPLLACLQEYARKAPDGTEDAYSKAYAIYALTRNAKVMTEEINSLKAYLRKNPGEWGDSSEALFLAASYSMLKMDEQSGGILDRLKKAAEKARADSWIAYPENDAALKAYLHAKHFPNSRQDILASYPDRFAELLESGRYSSFSSSMTILALAEFAKLPPAAGSGAFKAAQRIGGKASPLALAGDAFLKGAFSPEAAALSIDNPSALPVFYQATSEGFESAPPGAAENHGVEVYHEIDSPDGKKLAGTALGDEVLMRTRYRSLGSGPVRDLVIVDLLPGGFDPDIESIRAIAGLDYVDIREDRVVFYLSAGPKSGELSYKLRSVSRGTFGMAPSYAVDMYDPAIWSMNASSAVTVE